MRQQLRLLITFFSIFFICSSISAQRIPLIKDYKSGMVHYRSGKTLQGKFAFGQRYILYKSEDGAVKKEININSIKKLDIFKKKDTTSYAYFFDDKTYKSKIKKKKKLLGRLIYDYEHVKVYGVIGKGLDLGPISIGGEYLFLRRGKGAYARPLQKPFKGKYKLLKEALSNCKELLPKIGEEYKYNTIKQLKPILEYYNENCGVRKRKSRTSG